MKTVVQFGAGAIGRGFLGQLWSEAGYRTVFVDVDADLVAALNREGCYPLSLVTNETTERLTIGPVEALHIDQTEAILRALGTCDFAAVSIGPHVIDTIDRFFAPCLTQRFRHEPLNVVVAENDPDASTMMLTRFNAIVETEQSDSLPSITFIQAVVGRMVPRPGIPGDPLPVTAEPYKRLPLEAGKWLGSFPSVPGMFEQEAFRRYVEKKLYIHNAGHAALAYHGYHAGYTAISECAADPAIAGEITAFWREVNTFLVGDLLSLDILEAFEQELLTRFCNRALPDTVARVGRDPVRKLQVDDRLISPAIAYRTRTSSVPTAIVRAIAAALHFDPQDDPSAQVLQQALRTKGVQATLVELAHYPANDPAGLVPYIEAAYNADRPLQAT